MNIFGLKPEAFAEASKTGKVLAASGLPLENDFEERLAEPATFFYVKDHQTQWVWACSLPTSAFREATRVVPEYPQGAAAYCIAALVSKAAAGKADADWEKHLAMLLAAFIISTDTFAGAGRGRLTSHFLVLNYGQANMVRPASLHASDRQLIPSHLVLRRFDAMLAHDRKHYPQWVAD